MEAPLRIGTSGWEYAHWRGRFYPRELPRDRWLEFYAERFDTLELNATFYRLPPAEQFERWARRAPDGFAYAVKASRYLTHLRRLREPAEPLERLWSRARRLGDRLGPMLYQLPPRWRPNPERLDAFLARVPDPRRWPQAVEVRDPRWYRDDVLGLLASAGVGLCLHDMAGSAPRPEPVGPLAYVRFHGSGPRYGGGYDDRTLAAWADRLVDWSDHGLAAWVYFNNDEAAHAIRDAERLRELVEGRGRRTGPPGRRRIA